MSKNRKLKVALLYFPINNVGGITTWIENFQTGLNNNGVENQLFHCTNQTRCSVSETDKQIKYNLTILPSKHLSYHSQLLKQSLDTLSEFDAIIFTKASPHPTKDALKSDDAQNWQLFYSELKIPKVVVFHDNNWEKTNPWQADVSDYVDICFAGQHKFMDCVNRYPGRAEKYWDYHPFDLSQVKLQQKQNYGIIATQWLKWKNHDKIMDKLDNIQVPLKMFGIGQEYYELKLKNKLQPHINNDFYTNEVYNKEAIHDYHGFIEHTKLLKHYSKALFGIDLSTRGYTNYTHFEPLFYKAITMVERTVFEDPYNEIPEDCCYVYDLPEVDEYINVLGEGINEAYFQEKIKNGYKFAQKMDCTVIAKRLIDKINKLR